ncbi:MAG TPA: NAD(P)H-dependent oxidoreductase [Solirubrobacteraceae bacterium]|nr:NAD(P)H-dependent oxidoreductase [Solirubrobacteraceae bacterium]
MRVLGLSAGNPGGSAELLLGAALRAAEAEGAQAALVRLAELRLPTAPVGPGLRASATDDDGDWLWDQVMQSQGLIISSPIYSRTIAGALKLVADRLAGPAADVAFAERHRAMLESGETPPVAFPYDERVLAGRVAGLIAVGGARAARWRSLALPLMHQMLFSSQIALADQLEVGGAGMPRSVLLCDDALAGAERVGRSVGSQLGLEFEQVQYRGPAGLCPMCHLSVVVIDAGRVECATCGAGGRLAVHGGAATVRFDDPAALSRSVLTLAEKRAHFAEVQETAARQAALSEELERRAAAAAPFKHLLSPPGRERRS